MSAADDRGRRCTAYIARYAVTLLWLSLCPLACASNSPGQNPSQDASPIVLAPGESRRVPQTDITLTFVRVVNDSRCPTGATCIRAGEATVLIRVAKPDRAATDLTLQTSGPGPQEAVVDNILITLVDLMPYPREDRTPRPEDYRATLLIGRQ